MKDFYGILMALYTNVLEDRLTNINCDTLIMTGENDILANPE